METIRIALKDLEQNTGQIPGLPANPRQWTKKEIDKIAKSLQETPELFEARPIIVTQYAGKFVILGGNLRYEGCKKNKDKDAPCFIIPDDTPIDKMKEIIIKDNGTFGGWDYDALANEWDDLALTDWGVPTWDAKPDKETTDAKEDDFDENEQKIQARCKLGDIWKLGDHRLMCGDATSREDVEKLMNGHKADITITSPPYNAGHLDIPKSASRGGGTQKSAQKKYLVDNDKKSDEEYFQFLQKNMDILIDNSFEVFYNIGVSSGSKYAIGKMMDFYSENFKDMIYWVKENPMPVTVESVISSATELIMCFGKNGSRSFRNFKDRMFHGVIHGLSAATSNEYADIHKATFPIYLPSEIITRFSPQNGSVLDCFGGTGTTLIAAEQLNRRCYMMELDPRYCDVIIARWEKLTGKEATKLN